MMAWPGDGMKLVPPGCQAVAGYSMSRMVGGRRDTGTFPVPAIKWRCILLASKRLPLSRLEGAEPRSLFFFFLSSSTAYAERSALTSTEDCRHRPADAVPLDEGAGNKRCNIACACAALP
ncbi:hypothetical protein X797_000039 [Metarhizium robertsii]|uniref:Uncharacterized protein n=1 Tax=Metarhizium robertsii TaxID=568076 RepID=A0A0A1V503_9HYPO|nr:hypothetical protein X797_000039 [Metarhizium robertsii]